MKENVHKDEEFVVTYRTSDVVAVDDMMYGDPLPEPVTPSDVALFAVQRFLDGCGPVAISVDFVDSGGVTHAFDVYRWEGKWVCEVQAPETPACEEPWS